MDKIEMRAALVAAFEGPGDAEVIRRAIDHLTIIGAANRLPPDVAKRRLRTYSAVGKNRTINELRAVLAAAGKLHDAISRLHAPAVQILAERAIRARRRAHISGRPAPEGFLHHDLSLEWVRWHRERAGEAVAAAESMDDWKADPHRVHDMRASAVVSLIVQAVEEATGCAAALPGGCPGIEVLIGKVFEIIGVEADHRAAFQTLLKRRSGEGADEKKVQRLGV